MYLIPEGQAPVYVPLTQRDLEPADKPGTLQITCGEALYQLCDMGFIPREPWKLVAFPPQDGGEPCPCFLYAQVNKSGFLHKLMKKEDTFYAVPVRLSERELEFIYPVQFPEEKDKAAEVIAQAMTLQAVYWDKKSV